MRTIPQRELRNDSAAILRAAERGELFTITVDGRPVATLGPHRQREWVARTEVEALLRSPTDERVIDDLAAYGTDELDDPWEHA